MTRKKHCIKILERSEDLSIHISPRDGDKLRSRLPYIKNKSKTKIFVTLLFFLFLQTYSFEVR